MLAKRLSVLSCGAAIVLLWSSADPRSMAGEAQDALGAAADGYLANRESFDFFRCKFRVTRARCAGIEDALRKNYRDPVIQDGLWVVHGKKVYYKLDCDRSLVEKALHPSPKPEGRFAAVPCISPHYLSDGTYTITYDPIIAGSNILGPGDRCPGPRLTPFSMDLMGEDEGFNPGTVLRDCISKKYFARVDGLREIDQRQALVVHVGTSPDRFRLTYALDPTRGFFPIRISDLDDSNKRDYQAYITDMQSCSKDRWFPKRSVVVWQPDRNDGSLLRVQEIVVTHLDADQVPASDEFRIDLPLNTAVACLTKKNAGLRLSKATGAGVFDFKGLEKLYARVLLAGEENTRIEELLLARAAPRPGGLLRVLSWYVGIAAVILTVGVIMWRRRASKAMG